MKIIKVISIALAATLVSCSGSDKEYDASGVFETTEVIVSAEMNGDIMQLNVEEGQNVEAGVQLGYIDNMQNQLKKNQLRATQSSTDSRKLDTNRQVASIKQQISNQQREKQRFQDLLKHDAATQKQVDDIDYQIRVLKQQLVAAEEQVNSSNSSLTDQSASIESQVAQVNDQIDHSIIKSPIKGTVLTKYAQTGEYAVPGRALFKVADVENMKLRAYITADQLTAIKIGQKVKVYADSGKKDRKMYQGTITWISDKAEFTPKTIQTRDERANLVYAIKISVKNDGLIKRGMYGDVNFK
jgi:HlyD family secretion protein